MNQRRPFTGCTSVAEPLESRLLFSDIYVSRPEVLGPQPPGGGERPVMSAGGIDRISEDGSRATVVSGLRAPSGVAIDPEGNFYYIDLERPAAGGTQARLFRRAATGFVDDLGVVFDQGPGVISIGGWAFDVTPGPTGVYVNRPQLRSADDANVILAPGSIDHIGTDGTRTTVMSGLHHPSGVAVGLDGSLYVVDLEHSPIRATLFRRGADGAVTDMGLVLETDLRSGVQIGGWAFDPVVGPAGEVFVNRPEVFSLEEGRRVLKRGGIDRIAPNGRRRTAVSGRRHPSGLAFDAAGNLYFQDVTSGPLRAELFRARRGRGRGVSLGVVADTSGGVVSIGGWAFNSAVETRADLAASALVVTSPRRGRPAAPGGRGAARLSLSNAGPSPVSASAGIDLFISTDAVLDGTDVTAGSSTTVLRLKPGRTRAVKLRFIYPTVGSGDYFVLARVRVNAVVDANEANDTVSTATPVRVQAAPQP